MEKYEWLTEMIRVNFKSAIGDRKKFFLMAGFMAVNNVAWFSIWIVFMNLVEEINGWALRDMALLFGFVAFSFGVGFFVFGGTRHMAQQIQSGQLDVYLTRPRSPLLSLVFSRSDPSAVGDMISGVFLVVALGKVGGVYAALALFLGLCSAVIFASVAIVFNSFSFWSGARSSAIEQMFSIFMSMATMPQHGLPKIIRVLLFTVLPAGFVAFLPVDTLRVFALWKLGVILLATIAFPCIALAVFHKGLRRYTSGNQMLEGR